MFHIYATTRNTHANNTLVHTNNSRVCVSEATLIVSENASPYNFCVQMYVQTCNNLSVPFIPNFSLHFFQLFDIISTRKTRCSHGHVHQGKAYTSHAARPECGDMHVHQLYIHQLAASRESHDKCMPMRTLVCSNMSCLSMLASV